MNITSHRTEKIVPGMDLISVLDSALPLVTSRSVVVVTSKIISICQARLVKNDGTVDKHDVIRKEAQQYIDATESKYDVFITIKNDIVIANSGVDESNGGGYFVLWPENPFAEAARIWHHLRQKHHISNLGVIITDSRIAPLRWGTLGIGIAYCGFQPRKNYIGTPDVFGRKLRMTHQSVLDGLAAASVVLMGEGNEQTPIAVITEVPFVEFEDRPPTESEIASLRIDPKDDLFAPLLDSPKWKRGG